MLGHFIVQVPIADGPVYDLQPISLSTYLSTVTIGLELDSLPKEAIQTRHLTLNVFNSIVLQQLLNQGHSKPGRYIGLWNGYFGIEQVHSF